MIREIKECIEKHIDLIESEKFEELYKLQGTWSSFELVGDFTETLLDAGINPADYMKEIPPYYLYGTKIKFYTIPDNITSIGDAAFSKCNELTDITIGNNVEYIGNSAFGWCSGLKNVIIGNGVKSISRGAFYKCDKLESITYLGTKEQWNKIKLGLKWKPSSWRLKEIKCTDGTIIL